MSATAFATADAVIFSAFGVAADYKPAGFTGAPTVVTIIRDQASGDASGFGVPVRANGERVHVRIADIPALAKGDTFTIGATVLTVQGAPQRDVQASMWTAEC